KERSESTYKDSSRVQEGLKYVSEDTSALSEQVREGYLDFDDFETLKIYNTYLYGEEKLGAPSLSGDKGGYFAFNSGMQLRALELAMKTGELNIEELQREVKQKGDLDVDYVAVGNIPTKVMVAGRIIDINPEDYSDQEREKLKLLGELSSENEMGTESETQEDDQRTEQGTQGPDKEYENKVRQSPDFGLN
ncbi:MAG: hypothetical protein ACQEP6_01575, partial [Patescibacteria group bacterium]